jgi:hypothetical protein
MDQQPKIPTLKDAQKPQVKIKGLSAGLTLFDRLKQFKKKDLAFILAGLGTLFMAPLAEHFMMAPENGGGELEKGWGGGRGGSGSNFFGGGGSPYETGGGIAQGGAIGGAGDIITPLNVRDPSSLVMGPGQAQQPPAGSAAPATPPPSAPGRSETDYKDALAGAASRAASAAVKRSPLPIPKVALGGSGLRGLGVAGGGSSASGSLGPVGPAAGGTGVGGGGGGLNLVRATPNFRGAAGPRGSGNPQGLDGTKKAGQNAGDAFSRTGSALSGLNAAANEQIPTGGSGVGGGGQGGAGANDKAPGGSGPGGSKSVGESLAFLEQKQRMENRLKNEFELEKLKDHKRLMYEILNDGSKEFAKGVVGATTKSVVETIFGGSPSDSTPGFICAKTGAEFYPASSYCVVDGVLGTGTPDKCVPEKPKVDGCYKVTKAGKEEVKPPKNDTEWGGLDSMPRVVGGVAFNLEAACSQLAEHSKDGTYDKDVAKDIYKEATELSLVKKYLVVETGNNCAFPDTTDAIKSLSVSQPIKARQKAALVTITSLIKTLKKDVEIADSTKADKYAETYSSARNDVTQARTDLEAIRTAVGDGLKNVAVADHNKWNPASKEGENEKKLAGIKTVLENTRAEMIAALNQLSADQYMIDGGKSSDKGTIMPQLDQIISGPSAPIKHVQSTNAAFNDFMTRVADPAEIKGSPPESMPEYDDDAEGVKQGSTHYDKQVIVARDAVNKVNYFYRDGYLKKADDYATEREKVAELDPAQKGHAVDMRDRAKALTIDAEAAKTKAESAVGVLKGEVVGVKTAQTKWLENIEKTVQTVGAGK